MLTWCGGSRGTKKASSRHRSLSPWRGRLKSGLDIKGLLCQPTSAVGRTTERAECPDLRSDKEVDQTSGTTEEEELINKLFCADRQSGREREYAAGLPAVVVPCGDTGYIV